MTDELISSEDKYIRIKANEWGWSWETEKWTEVLEKSGVLKFKDAELWKGEIRPTS